MKIAELLKIVESMSKSALDEGMIPNGIVIGAEILSEIEQELADAMVHVIGSIPPCERTIFGIPITEDHEKKRQIRMTFDRYTWDDVVMNTPKMVACTSCVHGWRTGSGVCNYQLSPFYRKKLIDGMGCWIGSIDP